MHHYIKCLKLTFMTILIAMSVNLALAQGVYVSVGSPGYRSAWVPGHWYYGRWIPGHYVQGGYYYGGPARYYGGGYRYHHRWHGRYR